jgi:hypothetical protein
MNMTSSAFNERLREIMGLVASHAEADEIRAKAIQLKNDMRIEVDGIWAVALNVDQLVAVFAPDPQWQIGLYPEAATAPQPVAPHQRRYNRSGKTLELARGMAGDGSKTVRTVDIANRLRAEGETLPMKTLATAVGNILTRSGIWKRMTPGEYALTQL